MYKPGTNSRQTYAFYTNPEQTNTHCLLFVCVIRTTFGVGKLLHEFSLTVLHAFSQALCGADQGKNLSCLHPGAMMGQQAGKQRVAWQTLFSAISGGGL